MYLRTLGGLALEGSDFRRPQLLLLLAYLALEGSKSRRELADLFYLHTHDPRDSLSTALRRLRQGTEGRVKIQGEKVHTVVQCDAKSLLMAFSANESTNVLTLYRGPFLQGIDLSPSEELEEWIYQTRESLALRVRHVLVGLAERAVQVGDARTAAQHAETALTLPGAPELEPEDLAHFYPLLHKAGSPKAAEVRKAAEKYGLRLTEAHSNAPKSGTSTPQARHNLPVLLTSFIGRDPELLDIAEVLASPDGHLLTLHGPGGVGKTRLALQVAHDQLRSGLFPDGIFFIPLDAVTESEDVPLRIAETLNLSLKGEVDPLTLVKQHIGEGQMLLILDNFEHLITASQRLTELLRACPNLIFMVTSRERLNLKGEWVLPVEGLPVPPDDALLEQAEHSDALDLFIQRAKRVRLSFSLTAMNLPHALKICRLVGGYPLGIELAATWVKSVSLEAIVQELEENLDLLVASQMDIRDRHRSVQAAFEHSWHLLSEKEQDVLRKLAVFRGSFTREAASAVAGATLAILSSLIDKSLLRLLPNGRYDRHALLYQFTVRKLAEHPEALHDAQQQHAIFFFRFLEKHGLQVRGPEGSAALAALDEELENIRVAWHQAVRDCDVEKLQHVSHLTPYLDSRARFQEGTHMFELALAELSTSNPNHNAAIATLLVELAWLYQKLGQREKAVEFTKRGLALADTHNYVNVRLNGLTTLGVVADRTGNYSEAKRHYRTALDIAKELQKADRAALLLGNLAAMEKVSGNYRQAETLYLDALALHRKARYEYGIIVCLINLSELYLSREAAQEALPLLREARQRAQHAGHQQLLPYILGNLGLVTFELGSFLEAKAPFEEALEMARESKEPAIETAMLIFLGRTFNALGDHVNARLHLKQALGLAWDIQDLPRTLQGLVYLAESRAHGQTSNQAAEWLSLALQHPATDPWVKDQARAILDTHLAQGAPLNHQELEVPDLKEVVHDVLRKSVL